MSVLILGECGCTHEGDKGKLLELLEVASRAGASCFKPQWTSDPQQMLERRHIGREHPKRAYYEKAYSWLAWPVDWHEEFRIRCYALGMAYACSVYLPQDVATVAPFVDYLKISSFEANDQEMGDATAPFRMRTIVSTGMAPDPPDAWWWRHRTSVLHCVSAYPAPIDAMNLGVLAPWPDGTGYYSDSSYDGLSDHSRNLITGAVAVGAGATIIETHYRLDTCHPSNPDYVVAFTPAEFTQYVKNVRDAEAMMGTGVKGIQECEQDMLPYRVTL